MPRRFVTCLILNDVEVFYSFNFLKEYELQIWCKVFLFDVEDFLFQIGCFKGFFTMLDF